MVWRDLLVSSLEIHSSLPPVLDAPHRLIATQGARRTNRLLRASGTRGLRRGSHATRTFRETRQEVPTCRAPETRTGLRLNIRTAPRRGRRMEGTPCWPP